MPEQHGHMTGDGAVSEAMARIGRHEAAALNAIAEAVQDVLGYTTLSNRYAIAVRALEAMQRASAQREMDDAGADKRLVIRVRKDVGMSRNKSAAQAVHAALLLLGVHPGANTPVIVLDGSKSKVEACSVIVCDAGRTEVLPGTVTAGASWED